YNDENEEFFADNDERTIFFCKGALETVKKLGWYPDIIHCQGWMTSLIPLYLKTIYKDEPVFSNAKVIYSVYENDFKEDLGQDFMRKASLNYIEDQELEPFSKADCTSMHLGGIMHADAVVRCDDIDSEVELKLSSSQKPILNHTNDQIADNYLNFYNSLLTEKE
ncbi:MAG: starch synthase, partial [Bacteroidia bacterium]